MPKLNSVKAIAIASVVLFYAASVFGADQPVPPAPIPAQIPVAKKIFIANVPGARFPDPLTNPARTYDEFYAAMKTWGHYELVSAPADADLIFEVNFVSAVIKVSGTKSGCDSSSSSELQLVIVDPKTRTTLWWVQEDIAGAIRVKTWDKNFDTAMNVLVGKVQILSAPPAAVESGKP